MSEMFLENIKRALREYIQREHGGKVSRAESALGLSSSGILSKWMLPSGEKDARVPSLRQFAPLFKVLGIRVLFPWDEQSVDQAEIANLKAEIERLRLENAHKDGKIEVLMELLRNSDNSTHKSA